MIKEAIQHEKLLFASLGANGFLQWLHHFVLAHQPEATALLTWLQILVAALTVAHIIRKYIHKKK